MYIEPRILKGFRDILPAQEMERKRLVRLLEDSFSSYGFVPIDTPVLEYAEVLLGKGGGETDKQVYRFHDHGSRDVAMRFDLTVPFARFMAQHRHELYQPFKRYHISKVFRGENTQRGRYREFMQCDFDIVGTGALSADLEILLMIIDAFHAMAVPGVTVHLSHRGLFNRFLEHHGVADNREEILRIVDKLRKIGRQETLGLLGEASSPQVARHVLEFIEASGEWNDVLTCLEGLSGGQSPESERLRDLGTCMEELVPGGAVQLDPSITRGLDYYTGIVFETFLHGAEHIGSVCSGGRYDDLVTLYSREPMAGVGASIGLDRLMAALDELALRDTAVSPVEILVLHQDPALLAHYHRLARDLRAAGLGADVFPEPLKLGRQFAFAERKGVPWALICGEDEAREGRFNMRRMADRRNYESLTIPEALDLIRGGSI